MSDDTFFLCQVVKELPAAPEALQLLWDMPTRSTKMPNDLQQVIDSLDPVVVPYLFFLCTSIDQSVADQLIAHKTNTPLAYCDSNS